MIESGVPPQPGHSFCAHSLHVPKAPCAVIEIESLCASPSEHISASVQRAYGGKPSVARYSLILSTQSCAAELLPPPGPVEALVLLAEEACVPEPPCPDEPAPLETVVAVVSVCPDELVA